MEKLYSIIVGPDPDGLFFAPLSYVAHARIGSHYAYCTRGHDGSDVLHYSRFNDFLPLQPEGVVLARRVFIDFNAMTRLELSERMFAMKCMETMHGNISRIESFDAEKSKAVLFTSDKVNGEKTTEIFCGPDSLDSNGQIDFLCNKFRISVTCNQDLGEEIRWTAQSPHFSDMVMTAETRSRAVVQLVLWAFYQRTPFSYMGQKAIDELLKSHAVEV